MTTTGWRVRTGHPDDRQLLASFECADNAVMWQAEVERFIQSGLADWTFDPHAAEGDPRLLLAFAEAGDLFGIAAHERATLRAADGSQFHATKLEVIAIALKWQGRTLSSRERASDVLMQAVMNDVRA